MSHKIESYINALFTDVPRTKKARDLREELLGNMRERYTDYLNEGKNEAQAYSLTVASMGDLDAMLADVMPDEEFRRESQFYRTRNARNTAIAVALYILSAAVIVFFSLGDDEALVIKGVVALLSICAVATAIIIYTQMSTPAEFKNVDEDERRELELERTPEGRRLKAYTSIFWLSITAIYLFISFVTFAWHITWIIWVMASFLYSIARILYWLRVEK